MKHKDDITPIVAHKPAPATVAEPMPPTGCVVCGGWTELTESAGNARWHAACGTARPDVIARVKARA